MAKKKAEVKEYLYGTFTGVGSITINADTPQKKIDLFLKDNPKAESRITNTELIKAQRALMNK